MFVVTCFISLMGASQPDHAQRNLVGTELIECVNNQQGYIGNSKSLGYRFGYAYPYSNGRHRYEVIAGKFGSTIAWLVIVNTRAPQSLAYESLGFDRLFFKSARRNEAPKQVWNALKTCGVEPAGIFPLDGTTIESDFDSYRIPIKHPKPSKWYFYSPEEVNQYFE
ncbi:MAG: hypothetical protein ABJO30_01545 [Hyphomicrobiales bacterium]